MADPDEPLKRHWRIAGVATAIVLAYGAFDFATHEEPETYDESAICGENADDHLAGIWDEPTRKELHEHFETDSRHNAVLQWNAAADALNEQADLWTIGYSTTCDALAKAGGSDRELLWERLCFQWRLQQMDAVIKFLGQGDPSEMDLSHLPRQLGSIAACESFDTAYPELYLPSEKDLARHVLAAKAELAFAEAKRVLGRSPDPDAVGEIVAEARDLGHDPLTAEVLLALASHLASSDPDRAQAALDEAVTLADSAEIELPGYRLAEARKLLRNARSHATSRPDHHPDPAG